MKFITNKMYLTYSHFQNFLPSNGIWVEWDGGVDGHGLGDFCFLEMVLSPSDSYP